MQVLVVDNYDSFVFNLVQYLGQLGVEHRCGATTRSAAGEADRKAADEFDGVLLSPGPGTPERAGVRAAGGGVRRGEAAAVGVCLGHQAIGVAFGAP